MGIVRPLFLRVLLRECAFRKEALYLPADWKPSGPNLSDGSLKGFIVNPADLS